MPQTWRRICLALLILAGLTRSQVQAKPPDLPVDVRVEFDNDELPGSLTFGYNLFTGKLSLSFTLPGNLTLPYLDLTNTEENDSESLLAQPAQGRPNSACPARAEMRCARKELHLVNSRAQRP